MKSILAVCLLMAIIYLGTSNAQKGGDDDRTVTAENIVLKISKKCGKFAFFRELPEEGSSVAGKGGDGRENQGDTKQGDKGGNRPEDEDSAEGTESPEGTDRPDGENSGAGGRKPPGGKKPPPRRKTHPIEISMAEIKGRRMRGPGRDDMMDFCRQEFTLSDPENTTIPGTEVKAVSIMVSATLAALNDTVLKLNLYIIKENGTITIGDEEQEVFQGMVKFNIELSGGSWDDDIIIGMALKSRGKPQKKPAPQGKKRAPEFDLGGGGSIALSSLVKLDDGEWQDQCLGPMNETYPIIKERGNKQMMLFCVPQFNTNAIIDPTAESGYTAEVVPEDKTDGASSLTWSLAALCLSTLLAKLAM